MLLTDILGDKHNFFQFMFRIPFNRDNMHDQVCINGTVVVFNFKDIILFFQDTTQIICCKDMVFAGNWFDAVTAFETVYFWPDLPRCFQEVYRVLKPDGTFLICNESNGDTDKDEKWTEIIGGMTIYKDIELKAYLEQAGFYYVQIHKKKSWLCVTAQE